MLCPISVERKLSSVVFSTSTFSMLSVFSRFRAIFAAIDLPVALVNDLYGFSNYMWRC